MLAHCLPLSSPLVAAESCEWESMPHFHEESANRAEGELTKNPHLQWGGVSQCPILAKVVLAKPREN